MSWDTAAMFTQSERPSTGFETNLKSADLLGRGQEIGCGLKWRDHCRNGGRQHNEYGF